MDLKFSPREATLYFYNNNEIYRFKPKLILAPLKAFFQTNATGVTVGDTIRFYDVSSGYLDSYHWHFGDVTKSEEKNPTHTTHIYLNYGYYKAKLTVAKGRKVSQYEILLTILPALKSHFHFVKDESMCPVAVRFVNTSTGKIDSSRWDFQNNFSLRYNREKEPTCYYGISGAYNVTLTVYGMKNSSRVMKKVNVNVPVTPF